jgi:hypothetical protein
MALSRYCGWSRREIRALTSREFESYLELIPSRNGNGE